MKTYFLFILLFPIFSFSQHTLNKWETIESTDEFGDKNGETSNIIRVEGIFQNSAVVNSPVTVQITHLPDNAVLIGFYLYNKNIIERFPDDNSEGEISIKREDETVEEYIGKSFNLGIYFLSETDFYKIVTNGKGEKLKVYIRGKEFDKYSKSEFKFSFTTQRNPNEIIEDLEN